VELLLGIDMGTGSTKGVLVDTAGVVVAAATLSHAMDLPRPGWAEVDAESLWWREVCELSTRLTAEMPSGSNLAGVCVSGVGPCLVLCDDALTPLRPAILYGVEPRVFERATGWYGSNSYITAKLTGEYVLDHHTASQCDPLYVTRDFDWNTQWAKRICGHLPLPRLVWPSDVVGTVHTEAAAATGIPKGTPVVAGTVDAYAEAFSAGVRNPGDQMLMYGSTMFLVQVIDAYHSDPALWTTAGVERGSLALAAGTSTAGSLIGWLQTVTGGAPFDTLMAEAAAVPPGSDGLIVLPYLAGERTPVFDPHARGLFAGLTLRHGRGHLFRAAYEGIGFGIRQILEMFDDAHTAMRTVAVGGGLQSPIWAQTVSDITGRPQLVPEQAIGASYGGALLAAIGVGLVAPETDWARIDREITPNQVNHALYDDLYGVWRELYPATRELVHGLGTFGGPDAQPIV
jgi:xylulokinase